MVFRETTVSTRSKLVLLNFSICSKDIPNCGNLARGPKRLAKAIYPSSGPAGAPNGFAATVFRPFSSVVTGRSGGYMGILEKSRKRLGSRDSSTGYRFEKTQICAKLTRECDLRESQRRLFHDRQYRVLEVIFRDAFGDEVMESCLQNTVGDN